MDGWVLCHVRKASLRMTQHENFSRTSKSVCLYLFIQSSTSLLLHSLFSSFFLGLIVHWYFFRYNLPLHQSPISLLLAGLIIVRCATATPSSPSATSVANRLAPRFMQDLIASLFSRQSNYTLRRRWYWRTIWWSVHLPILHSIVNTDWVRWNPHNRICMIESAP